MRLVWSYLAVLEQETGWETYDPQLGRSLRSEQSQQRALERFARSEIGDAVVRERG